MDKDPERKKEVNAPEVIKQNVELWNKIANEDCNSQFNAKFSKFSKNGEMELQNYFKFLKEFWGAINWGLYKNKNDLPMLFKQQGCEPYIQKIGGLYFNEKEKLTGVNFNKRT